MNHFSVVQNLKGVSSLCESYEISGLRRLRSGFKTCTHTTRTLIKHDMSAQMNSPLPTILSVPWASTSRNTHAGLKNEDAEPVGLEVQELHRMLVKESSRATRASWKFDWFLSWHSIWAGVVTNVIIDRKCNNTVKYYPNRIYSKEHRPQFNSDNSKHRGEL